MGGLFGGRGGTFESPVKKLCFLRSTPAHGSPELASSLRLFKPH